MSLVIWCKDSQAKVLTTLGPVLAGFQGMEIKVVNDVTTPPKVQGAVVILALGNDPKLTMEAMKVTPKGRTTTSLRGSYFGHESLPCPIMFSYSPGIADMDYGKYVDLLTDVGTACRFAKTGSKLPVLGEYKYVDDFKELMARVEELYSATGKPVESTLDLETVGLDPYKLPEGDHPGAYIVTVQISVEIGKSYVKRFESRQMEESGFADMTLLEQLSWILSTEKISMGGANLKFDLHWIAVRAGLECTNFKFDTTLVGSLLDENRSNGLDVHVKIYAPELGGYCVDPATRLWREDLTWDRAENIKKGDVLVGFDEHPVKKGHRRCLRRSVVENVETLFLPRMKITTSRGREVVVSTNHAWLVKKSLTDSGSGNMVWLRTDELKVGQRIKAITDVTEKIDTFEGGWVSGFLDGEGHLYRPESSPRLELGWAQKPGEVWNKATALIASTAKFHVWNGKSAGVYQAKASTYSALKILQAFRPQRLLDKRKWEGITLPQELEAEYITAIDCMGVGGVVSLKTSTHTFVAEGLASHNSDEFDRKVDKSRMDLVPPETMLPYAGGDTDGCLRVRKQMKTDLLKDQRLAGFYVNILHPAARAFEMVERGGVLVDMDAYKELESDLYTELDMLTAKAKSIIGGRIVAKHHDPDKRGGLNLTKASLLVDFMFSPMGLNLKPQMTTEKTGAPSTSLDHLMMFKDVPEAKEFVSLLKDFSSATKTLSTYVVGFQKHIRSDGRFHPTYFLMANARDDDGGGSGTVTGRLSARDPAFQCCVADTKVLTIDGEKPILEIVESFERGDSTTLVLTHEGVWKAVVGVYRNGVRPVFRVTLKSGHAIDCTENHPLLTRQGWTRTDSLVVNFHQGIIFSKRPHDGTIIPTTTGFSGVRNLPGGGVEVLNSWEKSILEGWESSGLRVQGACDDSTFGCAEEGVCSPLSIDGLVSTTSTGGSGSSSGWGSPEQQPDELSLGHPRPELFGHGATRNQYKGGGQSNVEVVQTPSDGDSRVSQDAQVAGGRGEIWHLPDQRQQDTEWGALGFEASDVVSVEYIGDYETFDLTIQGSHSFVANGVVVHNTIPKHTKWAKKLRKCFPAPPGMLVLENDYSQGELRVIACLANEETMIEAYANNMDLHVITSGRFAGYSYEDMLKLKKENKELFDSIRQLGKAGNFGLIYGMGAEGFQAYAELNYGVKLALEEAAKFRDGFFETYHQLPVYHKNYKAFAKKHGYVASPLGRIRHLPLINSVKGDVRSTAERQAINSPVQGCLSDMMIWAIAISQQRGWFQEAPCFGAIHDAKYAYIPEDNHEFYVERELELMESLPFEKVGWKPQLKFIADAKVGKTMASLQEYERKK